MNGKYYRNRWPKVVIGCVVKYYYRYKLSLRDLREILLDRGIDVSHESLRSGCISLVRNMQSPCEKIPANGSQISGIGTKFMGRYKGKLIGFGEP